MSKVKALQGKGLGLGKSTPLPPSNNRQAKQNSVCRALPHFRSVTATEIIDKDDKDVQLPKALLSMATAAAGLLSAQLLACDQVDARTISQIQQGTASEYSALIMSRTGMPLPEIKNAPQLEVNSMSPLEACEGDLPFINLRSQSKFLTLELDQAKAENSKLQEKLDKIQLEADRQRSLYQRAQKESQELKAAFEKQLLQAPSGSDMPTIPQPPPGSNTARVKQQLTSAATRILPTAGGLSMMNVITTVIGGGLAAAVLVQKQMFQSEKDKLNKELAAEKQMVDDLKRKMSALSGGVSVEALIGDEYQMELAKTLEETERLLEAERKEAEAQRRAAKLAKDLLATERQLTLAMKEEQRAAQELIEAERAAKMAVEAEAKALATALASAESAMTKTSARQVDFNGMSLVDALKKLRAKADDLAVRARNSASTSQSNRSQLEERRASLSRELDSERQSADDARAEVTSLRSQVSQSRERAASLERDLMRLRTENSNLQKEVMDMRNKIVSLERERSSAPSGADMDRMRELEDINFQLEDEVAALQADREEQDRYLAQLEERLAAMESRGNERDMENEYRRRLDEATREMQAANQKLEMDYRDKLRQAEARSQQAASSGRSEAEVREKVEAEYRQRLQAATLQLQAANKKMEADFKEKLRTLERSQSQAVERAVAEYKEKMGAGASRPRSSSGWSSAPSSSNDSEYRAKLDAAQRQMQLMESDFKERLRAAEVEKERLAAALEDARRRGVSAAPSAAAPAAAAPAGPALAPSSANLLRLQGQVKNLQDELAKSKGLAKKREEELREQMTSLQRALQSAQRMNSDLRSGNGSSSSSRDGLLDELEDERQGRAEAETEVLKLRTELSELKKQSELYEQKSEQVISDLRAKFDQLMRTQQRNGRPMP